MAYFFRQTVLADSPLFYCRDNTGVDASGNGRDIAFNGGTGATAGASLVVNDSSPSISLDGGGYGTGASDSVLSPVHMTIGAIVKLNSTSGTQRIASKWNGSAGWILVLVSGSWTFYVSTAGGLDSIASSVPATTSRQHIIASFDGTTLAIYVNGTVDKKTHSNPGDATSNTEPLNIGSQEGGGGQYFNGLIDEVSIYSSASSDSRAAIRYAAAILDVAARQGRARVL